jgi:hypothetical protein
MTAFVGEYGTYSRVGVHIFVHLLEAHEEYSSSLAENIKYIVGGSDDSRK